MMRAIKVNKAATDIMEILAELPSPREAAAALAAVRANLWKHGGATSTEDICKMMNDDDRAALEVWEAIAAHT